MGRNSRKLVLDALGHTEGPVPVDLSSHRSSGMMAGAYHRLREYLDLPQRPPRVYDVVQQLAIIDDDVLDRFCVDAIELGRSFARDDSHWKPWSLPDGSDCLIPAWIDVRRKGADRVLYSPSGRGVGIQKSDALYFDSIYWAYSDGIPEDLSDLPSAMSDNLWSTPSPPGPDQSSPNALRKGARDLRNSTDRAVVALFGGNLIEWGQFLARNDNFLMMLAADPRAAHRLLDGLLEVHLANLEAFLPAVGEFIDVILFGDDLGMQTGPQISPEMYREFFKPRHAAMWKRAKELSDVKVMLHCCGGIRPLLEDLIDAGLDAVNPVQTSAAGMEPRSLKSDFGERICLWGGGCDTQRILPCARPEDVRRHVLERLEILSPGGGFVFQAVHNIMADVPPENIVAMFDAVAEFNAHRQG